MGRHLKVEIQKGAVNADEKNNKTMSYSEKTSLALEQNAMRTSAQRLHLHEPKTGNK